MTYTRPDMRVIESDMRQLIQSFEQAGSAAEQVEVLQRINVLRSHFQTMASLASVRNSINTQDAYYEAEQDFFDANEPAIKDLNIQLYKALGSSPFKEELRKKFGHQLFSLAEVSTKTFDPGIIEDLKEENRLGTEYTKLVASAEVEYEGQKMNLTALEAFSENTDRAIRKKAFLAKQSFFAKNEKTFDELYDKLVKVRTRIAHKLGYKNFVELGYNRMSRTDYNPEMVAVFREQILKHAAPLAAALRERQRERTGLDTL